MQRGFTMKYAVTRSVSADAAYSYASAPQNSSDETLVERIADGDQLAMRTLYARHHTPVYRFVLRIAKDQTVAEDVLSEVFLDVWRQAAQFEGRASVSTWLLAIARFKALSVLRRRSEAELDDDTAVAIPDPADNPEVTLQKKHTGEVVRRGIAQLSCSHAEVLDLVYYHGKSITETSKITGVPEATVKTRMFYARRKLAQVLQAA
jgi:RNA polymerase sigma-70 factor, ECF subfamily